MKKIIYILLAAFIFAGCNFLDVVPDDTFSLEDAFANETVAEGFLFGVYSFMDDPRNFRSLPGRISTNEAVVAYSWGFGYFPTRFFLQNQIGSSWNFGPGVFQWRDIWLDKYRAIRQAFIFLENINDVTPVMVPPHIFEQQRREWIGEAYFLVAWYHHWLFKNYGPIVLVDGIFTDVRARAHINDVIDHIVMFYDRAIERLPPTRTRADLGRADANIAKAMRARLLLYAASPKWNGDPAGIWADADPAFRALINTTRDNARWQRALTAIDEAINFAHANGTRLYVWEGADPVTGEPVTCPQRQAYLNVRNLFIDNWNSEVIWGHGGGVRLEANLWGRHTIPWGLGTRINAQGPQTPGISATLQAAMIFYSANGLPMESDPNRGFAWTPEGRMTVPAGAHTANLFLNREPRFHAAIGYHGGTFEFNDWEEFTLNMFWTPARGVAGHDPTTNNAVGGALDRLETGLAIKKTTNPRGISNASVWAVEPQAFPVIRLADLYLAYAEAHAELHGNLNARARGFIADIHERAGLSRDFFFANFTGDALIDAIRRERMIELIFESRWHFDLRRWQIAYRWHNEGMWASAGMHDRDGTWGLAISGQDNASFFREVNYTDVAGQVQRFPITFTRRMYLQPINIHHLFINELLIQNPGY